MGDESNTALTEELERRLASGGIEADAIKAVLPNEDPAPVEEVDEDKIVRSHIIVTELQRVIYRGQAFDPAMFREFLRELRIFS